MGFHPRPSTGPFSKVLPTLGSLGMLSFFFLFPLFPIFTSVFKSFLLILYSPFLFFSSLSSKVLFFVYDYRNGYLVMQASCFELFRLGWIFPESKKSVGSLLTDGAPLLRQRIFLPKREAHAIGITFDYLPCVCVCVCVGWPGVTSTPRAVCSRV